MAGCAWFVWKNQGLNKKTQNLNEEISDWRDKYHSLEKELAVEKEQHKAALQYDSEREQQLLALSEQALKQQKEDVSKANQEVLKTSVVAPLQAAIDSFAKSLQQQHTEQVKGRSALQTMVQQLDSSTSKVTAEAKGLALALRGDSQVRGSWGEQALERLLQASGLQKNIHYKEQHSERDTDGNLKRTDILLMLPDDKVIVVDTKVVLTSWLKLREAQDAQQDVQGQQQPIEGSEIDKLSSAFARDVMARVKDLAGKDYSSLPSLHALDLVFLYLPIESADAYLRQYSDVHKQALQDYRIVIVSPANFMPVLSTISYIWGQHQQQMNTQKIVDEVKTLMTTVATFFESFEKVGNNLNTAKTNYDKALSRLSNGRNNVLRHAERIAGMGVPLQPKLTEKIKANVPAVDVVDTVDTVEADDGSETL